MAEIEVDADEFVAVNPGEVAFGNGGLDVGLDFGKAGQVLLARGEGLFVEGFEVDGAQGANVRGELAVPLDEGALGHMDVGGDAREACAFGAEFEELVFGFVRMHGADFRMSGGDGPNTPLALLALLVISLSDGAFGAWRALGRGAGVEGRGCGVLGAQVLGLPDWYGEGVSACWSTHYVARMQGFLKPMWALRFSRASGVEPKRATLWPDSFHDCMSSVGGKPRFGPRRVGSGLSKAP